MPLSQKPVLETTSCQRPRRTASPISVDPFSSETLTSLLTSFAVSTDSLDRERIRRLLLASVRPDAPVVIRRFIGNKFEQTEAVDRAGQYTFKTYLEQLRKPFPERAANGLPPPIERLNVAEVTSTDGLKPIGSLTIREDWLTL